MSILPRPAPAPYPRYEVYSVALDNRPGWVKTIIIDRWTGKVVDRETDSRSGTGKACDFCDGNRKADAAGNCPGCGAPMAFKRHASHGPSPRPGKADATWI